MTKNEQESLDTDIPLGSEFGRLIHTQMVIKISQEDYESIAELYGEKADSLRVMGQTLVLYPDNICGNNNYNSSEICNIIAHLWWEQGE